MSLIINALKKAEDGGENQPEEKVMIEPKPARKSSKYSLKSDIFIIAVFAAVIGVSFSFFFLKFADISGKKEKKEIVVKVEKPKKVQKTAVIKKTETKTPYLEKIKGIVKDKKSKPAPRAVKRQEVKAPEKEAAIPVKKVQPTLYKGSDYVLNGIMYDSKKPMALINNKMVFVGKTVDALRVLRITETEVFVEIDNQQYILSME